MSQSPEEKLSIVGGGIVGLFEAFYAYLSASKEGKKIRITLYEKNKDLSETTTAHIVPSLTPNEILSVIPSGNTLIEKMKILFSEPGGLGINDVEGVNNTDVALQFLESAQKNSLDETGCLNRSRLLFELGQQSMLLWQRLYDEGDTALKIILEESNFKPCANPGFNSEKQDGHYIELIYNTPNAKKIALDVKSEYADYLSCASLSPEETLKKDPFLADFCKNNSKLGLSENVEWHDDVVALWRPGGCINTRIFLPKFYDYLKGKMGTYVNESNKIKDCFQIKFERKVVGVSYSSENKQQINGLRFFEKEGIKQNKHSYLSSNYVVCPGESVGTLKSLGFEEPSYAGFAGASLLLTISIPENKREKYRTLKQNMLIAQEGFGVAWQAYFKDNQVLIGVGGTKAFYSDQKPHKDEDFAKNRNLLQLNIINEIFPELISLALAKETMGKKLEMGDLEQLENNKIAERWVGIRSVAFDGFPTIGPLYNSDGKIANARCTTHLSSGGCSFAPASVLVSQSIWSKDKTFLPSKIREGTLTCSDSSRRIT